MKGSTAPGLAMGAAQAQPPEQSGRKSALCSRNDFRPGGAFVASLSLKRKPAPSPSAEPPHRGARWIPNIRIRPREWHEYGFKEGSLWLGDMKMTEGRSG